MTPELPERSGQQVTPAPASPVAPGSPVGQAPSHPHKPIEPDAPVERALLDQAVGGWRGLIDSGAPALVFVTAYLLTGQQMRPSVIAAVVAGAVILIWRLFRRESLQQVLSGFVGVAISAYVASRTGRAEDFFLLGILTNLGYAIGLAISLLVGWPAVGVLVGAMQGDLGGWRRVPELRAAYRLCTWLWLGVFIGRLAVTVPLYLAGAVGALGVAKVVLGWPPFLLAAYLSYRILHPVLAAHRQSLAHEQDAAGQAGDTAPADAGAADAAPAPGIGPTPPAT